MENRNNINTPFNGLNYHRSISAEEIINNISYLLTMDEYNIISFANLDLVCTSMQGYFYYFNSNLENKEFIISLLNNSKDVSNIIIAWNLMKEEVKHNINDN